jgi:hypothetical protein
LKNETQYSWQPAANLADGTYIVRLQARVDGKRYYMEEKVNITGAKLVKSIGDKVFTGAIYFSGSPSTERNEMEGLLAFDKYKHAWPYFTIVRSSTTIDIHEANQAVVDQEIQLASTAGLDYFAFLGDGYGLKYYMRSSQKSKLKFTLLHGSDALFSSADKNYEPFMGYIQDPQYLRVTKDGRPLIYIYSPGSYYDKVGQAEFKKELKAFSNAVEAKTGKRPIFVATATNLSGDKLKDIGFEDLSFYFFTTNSHAQTYPEFTESVETAWDKKRDALKASGIGVVPTASIGYDPRPKGLNPRAHAYGTDPAWVEQGTPEQIAQHVKNSVNWVKANPNSTHTKTVLIYAWNEFAEGGWLTPTIAGNNTNQRLNLMSKFLGGKTMSTPISPYVTNPPAAHPVGTITITSPTQSGSLVSTSGKIVVSGSAPNGTRITIKIGNVSTFFINGKTSANPNRKFSIEMDAPPKGTYTLRVTSPDATEVVIKNVVVK